MWSPPALLQAWTERRRVYAISMEHGWHHVEMLVHVLINACPSRANFNDWYWPSCKCHSVLLLTCSVGERCGETAVCTSIAEFCCISNSNSFDMTSRGCFVQLFSITVSIPCRDGDSTCVLYNIIMDMSGTNTWTRVYTDTLLPIHW